MLDLRDNEGGRYDSMLECATLLLPKGALIVSEIHRGGGVAEKRNDGRAAGDGADRRAGRRRDGVGRRDPGRRAQAGGRARRRQAHLRQVERAEAARSWATAGRSKFTIIVFRSAAGALPDGHGLDPDVEVEIDPREVGAGRTRCATATSGVAADAQLRVATTLLKLSR